MSRLARLRRNPRLLFWGRALTEVKALNALITLFYLHRGVSIDEVFYLSLVWSLTTIAFEVPTGYLADRFGRKNTLVLGALLLVAYFCGMLVAEGFWQFAGLMVLLSASFSCFSGTEEAVLYDTLKELGETDKTTEYNGKLAAARSVMKPVFPALGALLASNLLPWQFTVVIAIDLVAALGACIAISRITEPRHEVNVTQREKQIFRDSLTTIRREPFLLRAAMNKTLPFIGAVLMFRAYQPVFFDHGIVGGWFAFYYVLLHSITLVSHWHTAKLERALGTVTLLKWSALLSGVSTLVFVFTDTPWLLFVSILFAMLFQNAREPVFADAMNQRIASHHRATTLSNLSVLKGFLDIPILLACGYIAAHYGAQMTQLVTVALMLIAVIVFPIRQTDITKKTA